MAKSKRAPGTYVFRGETYIIDEDGTITDHNGHEVETHEDFEQPPEVKSKTTPVVSVSTASVTAPVVGDEPKGKAGEADVPDPKNASGKATKGTNEPGALGGTDGKAAVVQGEALKTAQ